jgi:hypothetical protein
VELGTWNFAYVSLYCEATPVYLPPACRWLIFLLPRARAEIDEATGTLHDRRPVAFARLKSATTTGDQRPWSFCYLATSDQSV